MTPARRLTDATWTELAELDPPPFLALPIGSCEQHGPHLPLDTDTRLAVAFASALSSARPAVWLGPSIAIGTSWEHHGFPGLLSLDADALVAALLQMARSADWCRGLVFVNGHGGNTVALRRAVAAITGEGRRALVWSPRVPGGDAHAGRTETSLLLAVDPAAVRRPGAAGHTGPLRAVAEHGVKAISPSGVLGDPAGASAAEGAVLFDSLADDLLTAFDAWMEHA